MDNTDRRRRQVLHALAATAAVAAWPAHAQTGKPLRLVVGFAPGGAADVMPRIIAKGLAAELGQQVIVDTSRAPTASSPRRR